MHYHIGEILDTTNRISENFLEINNCGIQKDNGNCTVLRTNGRVDFHFLYIKSGSCTALLNENEAELNPGEMIIYFPNVKQKYTFCNRNDTSYWLHFSGHEAKRLLELCGIKNSCIIKLFNTNRVNNIFERMVCDFNLGKNNFMTQSWLLQLFDEIKSSCSGKKSAVSDERIDKAVNLMLTNYSKKLNLDYYARQCSLSRDYFLHLFKRVIGIPPGKYLLNIRMNHAVYMLTYSVLSVQEIASVCGFDDALYFSRAFKRHIGISPSDFIALNRV